MELGPGSPSSPGGRKLDLDSRHMQQVSDLPETEPSVSTSIRKDSVAEQDSVSSYQLWGSMKFEGHGVQGKDKFEEDGHSLSHAKRELLHRDHQAQPAESNYTYDTNLGSLASSKESLPLGREYHRPKTYVPPSSYSWEKPSALESAPSSLGKLGHAVGKMRTRTNTLSATSGYLASYPSNASRMRKYPAAVEADFGLDHSGHCYESDRCTAFSSHSGQSLECCNEMAEYARGSHYVDGITPISHQWGFDDGGPSLPRGLQYGDEIPSLSSKKYNRAPSHSRQLHYGAETPFFSRRQGYGDEIPSLSRNWRYRDKIPLQSNHWCHNAEAHPPSRYQQGASNGNGHSRQNFDRICSSEHDKITTRKHTFTKPRMANRVVSNGDHYRITKGNRWRNSEDIRDQVCGPRANKLNNGSLPSTVKDIMSPLVRRDQFNRSDFSIEYKQAKFFMIKSYSEDDIHKGIKYNVWASTPNGNNKLDAAYHEAQTLMKENGEKCPVFLFFSVNNSGQFVGMAEMLGPIDFKKTMDFWELDRWNGFFPIMWHIIKDIPNRLFKHIVLEYNDNRVVTFSRDTQEIRLPQGLQMLKIFKEHPQGPSILDDFDFYEQKDNAQKRINSESTHQAMLSGDFKSMEELEASMESWSLHESWD